MSKIEQRAIKNAELNKFTGKKRDAAIGSYMLGATEQQAIDIANAKAFAKKWLDEIINLWLPNIRHEPYYSRALEDIYKKLEKAMKDESNM